MEHIPWQLINMLRKILSPEKQVSDAVAHNQKMGRYEWMKKMHYTILSIRNIKN